MAEIARYLEAPRSSLFPILHTMEDRGYLRLDGASQCYLIGQQAFLTGSAYVFGIGHKDSPVTSARRLFRQAPFVV